MSISTVCRPAPHLNSATFDKVLCTYINIASSNQVDRGAVKTHFANTSMKVDKVFPCRWKVFINPISTHDCITNTLFPIISASSTKQIWSAVTFVIYFKFNAAFVPEGNMHSSHWWRLNFICIHFCIIVKMTWKMTLVTYCELKFYSSVTIHFDIYKL